MQTQANRKESFVHKQFKLAGTALLSGIALSSLACALGQPYLVLGGLAWCAATAFYAGKRIQLAIRGLTTEYNKKDQLIAQLQHARQNADQKFADAEKASHAKSKFLATMSHEVRTPLNAILGFSEILKTELYGPVGHPTYKAYANDIHDAGQYVLSLVNDVLDVTRIEQGERKMQEEWTDLYQPLQQAKRLAAVIAKGKNVIFTFNALPGAISILGDGKGLQQIAFNLVTNAIKYGPEGGQVTMGAKLGPEGQAHLYVQDQGPGIPPEERLHVLAAFKRGRLAVEKGQDGFGLGLSIVHGIMKQHGGTIEIEDAKTCGTIVTCTFPRVRVRSKAHSTWQNNEWQDQDTQRFLRLSA